MSRLNLTYLLKDTIAACFDFKVEYREGYNVEIKDFI